MQRFVRSACKQIDRNINLLRLQLRRIKIVCGKLLGRRALSRCINQVGIGRIWKKSFVKILLKIEESKRGLSAASASQE